MKLSKYIFLAVGTAILIFLFKKMGLATTLEYIKSIGWGGFFLICSIFIFSNIFLAYAWRVLVNYPLPENQFYKFVLARVAGDATSSINAMGAVAGEPLKAMYVKDILPLRIGLATVVLDRLIHTVSNILMVLTGMLAGLFVFRDKFFSNLIAFFALLIFFIIILFIFVRILKNHHNGVIMSLIDKLPEFIKSRILSDSARDKIQKTDEEISYIFSSPNTLRQFYTSLAIHYFAIIISCSLEIYLIVKFIAPHSGFLLSEALFVYIFGFIATSALFFVPANIGTSEGSYSIALKILGYDPVIGFSLGIIRRFRTFVWAAIGIVLLFYAGLIKKDH
ncbi:MAG TPA: lysylphosphatidylglycerol synthase transmembrane domain-containing protein [Spirochaetota bacterium]|nr:lysylphosphatidylglycerol synthase transmembrane domain-containing protein [Spirochaetota bacterium]HOK93686.1 lysylphosphatidylglycerol synthase transmembrane domain-containing protein [Spirochaetota bacterium]HPP94671.1 lysylphosphatidylglycerol synthase transmembrane domain-containing protein [Spirochaetota bacterium]